MLDDFILLLESEKAEVKEILRPHLLEKIFKSVVGGFFDDTRNRFVAFAYMPVQKTKFYEYNYFFDLSNGGHSAVYFSPETKEKTRKYIDHNSFHYKSSEELIEEGIYKSLLISYYGEFDFGEWNILRECCFCDTRDKNKLLKSKVDRIKTTIKDYFFNGPLFEDAYEHHLKIFEHMRTRYETIQSKIPADIKPFERHSTLVAMVRAKKSGELNLSFQEYIKKAIYLPLVIKLKTLYPEKYRSVYGFYGQDCNFLIPSHRRFCLISHVATGKNKKPVLEFYVYSLSENKLYEWIYFKLFPSKEIIDHDIILRLLSPISQLDDMDYVAKRECSFDDNEFWTNYVFKKENNEYTYLTEMQF